MKKLVLSMLTIASLLFTSCGDDDSSTGGGAPLIVVETSDGIAYTGTITENTTWTNDTVYILSGRVIVAQGATLTIEEGTLIKGESGTGNSASALIVARGGKLIADGTAAEPIIFTATADNLQLDGTRLDEDGNVTITPNLSIEDNGRWGGIIVLGNAPSSFRGNVPQVQIEGIPATVTAGLYGGNVANDNSGILDYISIRHGGTNIGEGNEINGLTLGGVGSGTTISNIEVVANQDDGVEFFGGTVDASNVLVWGQGDDALDIDQAYSGTVSNSLVILTTASDHGLEIDGPEGTATGSFKVEDVTLIGDNVNSEYADYRSGARGATNNVLAYNFFDGADVELDNNGVAQNFLDGNLTFSNWEIVGFDNSIFSEKVAKDDNDVEIEDKIILNPSFTERAADWTTQIATKANASTGADTSVFAWTYASAQDAF